MALVNFHVDDLLLRGFDEKARRFGLNRTDLLTALMTGVVKLFEDEDFAERMRTLLLSLSEEPKTGEAKSSGLVYAEAYKRAKKTR